MWLIYLLLILDRLVVLATIIAIISGIAFAVTLILNIVTSCEPDDFSKKVETLIKKIKNNALLIFILSLLIACFVPDSKKAAIIFTVGNTIEYVQNNEKLQELPDKAIQCLDKFVTDYLTESEKE